MENTFQILDEKEKVGTATVHTEGLYYCIKCQCVPKNDGRRRIYLVTPEKRFDLGLVVPDKAGYSLTKKVAAKSLINKKMEFYISNNQKNEEIPHKVKIEENAPFSYLSDIKRAHLTYENKLPYMVF